MALPRPSGWICGGREGKGEGTRKGRNRRVKRRREW